MPDKQLADKIELRELSNKLFSTDNADI